MSDEQPSDKLAADTVCVLNVTRRPVDLPSGLVLEPGERASESRSDALQRKVDAGLLRRVEPLAAEEPVADDTTSSSVDTSDKKPTKRTSRSKHTDNEETQQ